MKRTSQRRSMIVGAVVLIALGLATTGSTQELGVLRAQSLNRAFDSIEAISQAAGKPVNRQTMMGMATGMLGIDPGEFLDMERPVAVVLPVEGMMLKQNGIVASVPVTNATAAVEALAALFPNHTVDGSFHTFANDQGATLYLLENGDYLRLGGNSDLVNRFDPLSGAVGASALSFEIFLEPISPMIAAGLQAAKAQVESTMATAAEQGTQEMPYDPEAMVPVLDMYIDGAQSVVANTSSLRMTLDVEEGFVRFTESLVPKKDSTFAAFVAAQQDGLPDLAKIVDPEAAMVMAGTITLTDDSREGLKRFIDRYMSLLDTMFTGAAKQAGATETEAEQQQAPAEPGFWQEYMTAMGPLADRWIDCLRGDMAMSFDLPEGQPFSFVEAFGMNDGEACSSLLDEMMERLGSVLADSDQLSSVFSVSDGPRVSGASSMLMTIDMPKILELSGQPTDPKADELIKQLYGEKMTAAMATVGDIVLATGGNDAGDRLLGLAANVKGPERLPSFAPLKDGPGLFMVIHLGRFMTGIMSAIPDDEIEMSGAAAVLNGKAGRIPMGLLFHDHAATFEAAVPLETIEAFAAIAEEERQKKQGQQVESAASEGD